MSYLKLSALSLAMVAANSHGADIQFQNELASNGTLVLLQEQDQTLNTSVLSPQAQQQLQKALNTAQFNGEYNKHVQLLAPVDSNYERVVVVGLGAQDELDAARTAKLGGNVHGLLEGMKVTTANIDFATINGQLSNTELAAQFAHGVNLRDHSFDTYKQSDAAKTTLSYHFDVADQARAEQAYQALSHIEQGVFLARDLTSEVPSALTPVEFAQAAQQLRELGVKVEVLGPEQIKALGMGALEGVGRGSKDGARLVVAHYQGSDDAPIALVGKGITFDSGGYSIKTGASIARMKSDMAGAAAVLGTVKAMALSKADVNVVAVMGMAANMVSETAIAPGDILRTAEGLSVEVLNTDAEGRLVLSDAMWYARSQFKPQIMVDVATLTGSKVRAVGNRYSAIFSDDEQLVSELTAAGKAVNEQVWRLPLGYKDKLKSDIADIQNIGSGGPGATTAASFLQHFAGDTRWVHLDIAGNALASKADGEVNVGGTGYGVRLLSEWLLKTK
ncbi:leucyl aminopeptidase [Pseudoalteromonas ruthenica]|uniref:leucyl aminopeptidase n=1 Tax=Pseudoalteromonas ruthenica TaxID=151081 RepID=UPI00241ECBDB|nr:leucyl aminopeptidase [Pseudoalteromonas ruthenica]